MLKKTLCVAALCAASWMAAAATAGDAGRGALRPLTPEAVTQLRNISSPQLTADGAWFVYEMVPARPGPDMSVDVVAKRTSGVRE